MAQHYLKKLAVAMVAGAALAGSVAGAQVRTVDPNSAIDRDLAPAQREAPRPPAQAPVPADTPRYQDNDGASTAPANSTATAPASTSAAQTTPADNATRAGDTYQRKDLITAAEGVFGKGAQGLGGIIEKILSEQGEPNAYIAGREAAGALVVGLRYGSGIMSHRIEGDRPVYWTGPSIGFDAGGDASKVFVLVYNLYDTQEIYRRYPQGEGRLYFVGGFSATYLRRGKVVLIPVRLGVGARAGVNIGYMKFREKANWIPF